jgi:hypothetical protein
VNALIYEVTFLGEVHDRLMSMSLEDHDLQILIGGDTFDAAAPPILVLMEGDRGLIQEEASMGVEPDGDFMTVWTQHERFTEDAGFSFYFPRNSNIYYRRMDETTDTAGPRITELVDPQGNLVANGDFVEGPVQYVVLTFDENMMTGDPATNPDSILNPDNFVLFRGGVEIPGGVAHIDFGMNRSADLAGTTVMVEDIDGTLLSFQYDLDSTPSNKWEAVLVLDANGSFNRGIPALKRGEYTLQALTPQADTGPGAPAESGLRDRPGNPLAHSGFTPGGVNMARSFVVTMDQPDLPVNGAPPAVDYINATTHPETPGAVAVDGDGDHGRRFARRPAARLQQRSAHPRYRWQSDHCYGCGAGPAGHTAGKPPGLPRRRPGPRQRGYRQGRRYGGHLDEQPKRRRRHLCPPL